MTRDWDAPTYDRVADPMTRWGGIVLDRLPLRGDERVLDAGCGSGRVTEQLLSRLPHGRVVALDASAAMVAEARRRLAPFGDRVEYLVADLAAPLPIEGPVDAILSTATLHWVADHDAVFGNLAAVLRPGGRLVAQAGGPGNVRSLLEALASVGEDYRARYNFADPETTRERLEAAGFVDIDTWLQPEPTAFASDRELVDYLVTVIMRQLSGRPAEDLPALAAEAARLLPGREVDYVRLNITARRGPAA
ncbi:MAG: trans-aconitate 2-methyltransferase [Chloroflexota bacterium]|jgi:trans-aconitate 2-methyltransferase|nr:trans-aconitate 2-methyltransferase [Chloroflexota bacterium]